MLVLVLSVVVVLVVGGHLSVKSLRWCGVMVLLVVRWRWLWSKGWVIVLGEAGMESWDAHLGRFQALIVIWGCGQLTNLRVLPLMGKVKFALESITRHVVELERLSIFVNVCHLLILELHMF